MSRIKATLNTDFSFHAEQRPLAGNQHASLLCALARARPGVYCSENCCGSRRTRRAYRQPTSMRRQ